MNIAEKELLLKQDFDDVYKAGKKSQHDEFWDTYQKQGTLTNYRYAFSGVGWTIENFKPKYAIQPVDNADGIFYHNQMNVDLVEYCKKNSIVIDFSKCVGSLSSAFNSTKFTRIGIVNGSKANTLSSCFAGNNKVVTIDKVILKETGGPNLANAFGSCSALQNIEFEGLINTVVNFYQSPLTRASIENVISHLSDTTTCLTATFKKTAKESAFTTEEWNTLIATKTNWTFSLV